MLVTEAKAYFVTMTMFNRAPTPEAKLRYLRNEVAILHHTETNPHVRKRLRAIIQPEERTAS